MNKKQLSALGMHQLLVIDFLKTCKDATKKDIQDNVTINKSFTMEFDTMMDEMIELGYVEQTVNNSRKSYNLNKEMF